MALSGTITGKTNNDNIAPKIVWSATQSLTGNYSTVTATLYYSRTNTGYTTKGTGSFSLTINGKKASASKYVILTYNSNTVAISHKVQVAHDADGTKKITISATGSIPDTTLSSTTISAEVTLDKIPRATTPTLSETSVDMGSTVTISTPRASSSFTHELAYKFAGSDWQGIASGVANSYEWPVPNLAADIPTEASGVMTIRCITKNGDTKIGEKTVSLTVKVPTGADYGPKITKVEVTEATDKLAGQFKAFIQNKSKLSVTITTDTYESSTIKSCVTTFLGVTYKTASFTTGAVNKSGTLSLVTTVTDSRGRTATKTTNISVLAYSPPKLLSLDAKRFDNSLNPDPEGKKVIIDFRYSLPSLNGGNLASFKVSYKTITASDWTPLASHTDQPPLSNPNFTVELSTDYQYDILLEVSDWFGAKSSAVVVLPSGAVIADIKANGKGLGIGKTAELDNTVDVAWNTLLRGGANKPTNLLWDASVSTSTNGWYMSSDTVQTVNLSQKISDQLTGVVFAWSAYDATNKTGTDQDWHFFFVPKHHVTTGSKRGVWMCDAFLGLRKYLYINDSTVTGHDNNNKATTTNGIAFDNTKYVLRYIAGV